MAHCTSLCALLRGGSGQGDSISLQCNRIMVFPRGSLFPDSRILRGASPLTSPLCSLSGSREVLRSPTSCSASLPLTPLPQRKLASAQTCTVVATPFHEERRRTRAKVRSELPSSPLFIMRTHSTRISLGRGRGKELCVSVVIPADLLSRDPVLFPKTWTPAFAGVTDSERECVYGGREEFAHKERVLPLAPYPRIPIQDRSSPLLPPLLGGLPLPLTFHHHLFGYYGGISPEILVHLFTNLCC